MERIIYRTLVRFFGSVVRMNPPQDLLLAEYRKIKAAQRAQLFQAAASIITVIMLVVVGAQLFAYLLTGTR